MKTIDFFCDLMTKMAHNGHGTIKEGGKIMNIVLGLTNDDIAALDHIQSIINLYYNDDDFPEEMTEKDCQRYEEWINMSCAINKICYVIENQMEIDKTAAGRKPAAVDKECCAILNEVCQVKKQETGDQSVFLKKMIEFLDRHEIPESILIDTGQNYKKCQ